MMYPTRSEVNVNSFAKAGKHEKREHCFNAKEYFSIKNRKQLFLKLILIFAWNYQLGKYLH